MDFRSANASDFRALLIAATTFFLMSFWLHYPALHPNNFSDIMDVLWPRIHSSGGIVPYFDYQLEYPVISGLVLWLSSLFPGDLYTFYFGISTFTYIFMIVAIVFAYRIMRLSNIPTTRISNFIIFTPAFVYFSIYGFDWLGISLLMASIYYGLVQKPIHSGILMGLAIAARIIPIVCFPFLLLSFGGNRNRLMFCALTITAWIGANLYLLLFNFKGLLYTYVFQANWGVEDSWLIVFPESYVKPASAILLAVSLLFLTILFHKGKLSLLSACLLAMLAFVLTSYKFPPQYLIMLLPLLALNRVNYLTFMTINLLDVMLILWYFTPFLSGPEQLALSSPVQWIAILRQVLLLPIFYQVLRNRSASSSSTPGQTE